MVCYIIVPINIDGRPSMTQPNFGSIPEQLLHLGATSVFTKGDRKRRRSDIPTNLQKVVFRHLSEKYDWDMIGIHFFDRLC